MRISLSAVPWQLCRGERGVALYSAKCSGGKTEHHFTRAAHDGGLSPWNYEKSKGRSEDVEKIQFRAQIDESAPQGGYRYQEESLQCRSRELWRQFASIDCRRCFH